MSVHTERMWVQFLRTTGATEELSWVEVTTVAVLFPSQCTYKSALVGTIS